MPRPIPFDTTLTPHPLAMPFRHALREKGWSLARWGAAQSPTMTHPEISQVLTGRKTSARIAKAIERVARIWERQQERKRARK